MAPTEDKIFAYYQSTFKMIYGDLLAVIGYKPLQVSSEIEAMISHIAVSKTSDDRVTIEKNLSRAEGHLQRATLDAVKILWIEYRSRAEKIMNDDLVRRYCASESESNLFKRYHEAEKLAIQARQVEIQNVGIDPEKSVLLYYDAANGFRNLLDTVDLERVESIKQFKTWHIIKQGLVGFLVGILSSAIVAWAGRKYNLW